VNPLDNKRIGLNEKEYTAWDLLGVRGADIVFAYMEHDNPAGHGMCLEIGYGRALGKTIVFVCEVGHVQARYFGMARACADVCFADLEDGIEYLKHLLIQA
jgi:nucleoside 2-deoxyribosyltransferase